MLDILDLVCLMEIKWLGVVGCRSYGLFWLVHAVVWAGGGWDGYQLTILVYMDWGYTALLYTRDPGHPQDTRCLVQYTGA